MTGAVAVPNAAASPAWLRHCRQIESGVVKLVAAKGGSSPTAIPYLCFNSPVWPSHRVALDASHSRASESFFT